MCLALFWFTFSIQHIMQLDISKYINWAGNNYQRIIALQIALNSRAVYNFLKANRMLGENLAVYAERTQQNRGKMANRLNDAAVKSGNPLGYARMVQQSIPMPTTMQDINYARQAAEKLMRDNPGKA